MVEGMKVHGKIIICMVMAFTLGKMVGVMRESTSWTRNMALEFMSGPMEDDMRVTG
jgi:hypothetical protein